MAGREIDDVYHRIQAKNSYKKTKFEGKKSVTDAYTGEKIFYGNRNDAIYKHPITKTADVDHITPIAVIKDRYDDLTIEQQRKLANATYNYAITNSQLNRIGKNSLENHEYLTKEFGNVVDTLQTGDMREAATQSVKLVNEAAHMLPAETKSRIYMTAEATYMRIGNVTDRLPSGICQAGENFVQGSQEALAASVIPLTAEAVKDLCRVSSGDLEVKEAAKRMGKLTVEVAVAGGTRQVMVDGVSMILKKSHNTAMRSLAGSNELTQIIVLGLIVKDSAMQYLNGQIDGDQFLEQVKDEGLVLMAGTIGAAIGGTLGTVLLPGVGTAVGEIIGSLVTTVACGAIVSAVQTSRHLDDYRMQDAYIKRIEGKALHEMAAQRQHLKTIYEQEYRRWDDQISNGFDLILRSACEETYDLEGITVGLDKILRLFGKEVAFKNLAEYEAQIDKPLVLHMGRK